MTSFAVLISGRGTNMAAIAQAVTGGRLKAHLRFVASDNPEAAGLKIAEKMGFSAEILEYGTGGRAGAEEHLTELCMAEKVEWIVLAGFMRVLSPGFVAAYRGHIVNIHPSLLPSFPGRDGIGDAWKYGVKITGVTVHLVNEGIDSGPILAQKAVPVRVCDTLESLEKRIHRAEHDLYWKTLAALFSGVTVSERS